MTEPCSHAGCTRPGRLRPDPDGDRLPRVLCRRCARAFERFSRHQYTRECRKRDAVLWRADSLGPAGAELVNNCFDPAQRLVPTRANRWTTFQLELDLGRRQARFLLARAG